MPSDSTKPIDIVPGLLTACAAPVRVADRPARRPTARKGSPTASTHLRQPAARCRARPAAARSPTRPS
eukprot:904323-Prymnesium_polylepis.1